MSPVFKNRHLENLECINDMDLIAAKCQKQKSCTKVYKIPAQNFVHIKKQKDIPANTQQ